MSQPYTCASRHDDLRHRRRRLHRLRASCAICFADTDVQRRQHRQADLCRQPAPRSAAQRNPRYRLRQRSISATARRCAGCSTQYQPDAVMNLAAESHVDRSIDGPGEFIQTNVVGTFTLLQEALRYWRRLAADKRAPLPLPAYLDRRGVRLARRRRACSPKPRPMPPNSPYSASKASSDHLVRAWRETYDLPTLVTNCSNNYGPYHFPEKLIPHMIIKGWRRAGRCRSMATAEYPRLALCRGSCPGADAGARARASSARPTISAAATSAPTCTSCRRSAICSTDFSPSADRARAGKLISIRHRPAGPRPPLRDRCLQARARARLAAAGDLRDRDGRHRRVVHAEQALVGGHLQSGPQHGTYRGRQSRGGIAIGSRAQRHLTRQC